MSDSIRSTDFFVVVLLIALSCDFIVGDPLSRPIPDLRNWQAKQQRDWIYSEIHQFLEQYVFLHKAELTQFVNDVEDLRVLDKTGYPCRECGKKFKFHSTRVKYVL